MYEEKRDIKEYAKMAVIILLIVLVVFFLIFAFTMFVSVGVGYALLIIDPPSKTISGPILGPTWYVKMPWQSAVQIYYTTDTLGMWGNGTDPHADFPAIPCFSKDQLEMEIDVMLRWTLDPGKIKELYKNYPNLNYKEKTIASIMRERIRFVTKKYTAMETIEKRDLIADEIRDEVFRSLKSEPSLANALISLEFELRNIGLPSNYIKAIEAKLVAEQQMIQADYERQRIIILANATAQEVILKAGGDAEAKIIEANATRQAIEMILESVGQSGNETRIAELYLWVQTLQRIAPDVRILIIGADGMPVLIPSDESTSSP